MFRFLHQNTEVAAAQDVEMGIGTTQTASHPPIPPQEEDMVMEPLLPKNTPEILAIMEKQSNTIAKVSHYSHCNEDTT